jgi:hypothetical protein
MVPQSYCVNFGTDKGASDVMALDVMARYGF